MRRKGLVPLLAATLVATPAVWAGNGHTLHGVGAVNSSMGGAGVALPIDTIGGLLLNPAPAGPLKISGRTDESGDRALIPAFGFVHHTRGSNFAYGIGFLGLAGFGA